MKKRQSWVYILKLVDDSYYTGSTTNLDKRIYQHHTGYYEGYTKPRRPLQLVWHEEFATIQEAFAFERQIKGWSRAKKEALIRGDFKLLHELSQSEEMRERRRKRGSGS